MSDMDTTLRATSWFGTAAAYGYGSRISEPPRGVVVALIADLQQQLDAQHLHPIGLALTLWPEGPQRCATIALICAPGQMVRSLASWFQWQHPRWQWADAPPPLLPDPARDARIVEGVHAETAGL